MRVLFLRRQAFGGLSAYADGLIFTLPRFGIEAVIEDAEDWIPNETGPVHDNNVSRRLRQTAQDFDLVHALGYRSAWACAEAFGGKEAWVYSAYDLPKTTHPRLIERLSKAQKGICSSYAVFNELNAVSTNNLDVIYPAPRLNPLGKREGVGIEDEVPVVAALGTLDENSGFHALVRAMDEVWSSVPEAHLVIGGTGPEFDNLRSLRFETAKPDQIQVIGRVIRAEDLYAAADLFVAPQKKSGFRLSVVEAMAHGRPVLVRGAGGLPEIIHEHVSGLVFSTDDELGYAIGNALGMPMTLEAIGNAAAIRANEMFELEQNAERIAELYRNVVS